jgi:hypothetical protein
MKTLSLSAAAYGAAILLSLASRGAAVAQPPAGGDPAVVSHGDWTLRQREDWVGDLIQKSLDDGSLDKASFNQARLEMDDLRREESRMRHDGHGELTGNQTADLEGRLDTMIDKIHWANASDHHHPW